MAKKKTLEHYLRQLRLIEEHREKHCEQNIRRLYKDLMKDLQEFLGVQYANLAVDDKLTYEILHGKANYARFLEEVEQRVDKFSPQAAQEIRNTVQLTYDHAYKNMVTAVENYSRYEDLELVLTGLKATTPSVIKNVVINKRMEQALEKNHKTIIHNIRQQIGIGLSQGDRMSTMAKRLSNQVDMSYRKAMLIARTEVHRAREAGHQDSCEEIAQVLRDNNSDYIMTKTWKTMQDMSVRPYRAKGKKGKKTFVKGSGPDHVRMHNVTVLVDEDFDLGDGNTARCPGESGVAGHDCNCRCRLSRDLILKSEYEQKSGKKIIEDNKVKSNEKITTLDDIKGTKLYDEISNDLESYVGGGYISVADALGDKTKLKYIKNSMEETTESLYRIEESTFTLDRKNLKVGETFEFDDDLRSASRSRKYVDDLLGDYSDVDFDEPVIFETVGKAKHFNMDEFTSNYVENQYESLIGGKFEVVDIIDDAINGKNVKRVKIKQNNDVTDNTTKTIKKPDKTRILSNEEAIEDARKIAKMIEESDEVYSHAKIFEAVLHENGHDGLPDVVSARDFEKLSKDKTTLFRGFHPNDDTDKSVDEMIHEFKYGKLYCADNKGYSFGRGTYFTIDESLATAEYGRNGGKVIEAILSDDAKIVDFEEILEEYMNSGIMQGDVNVRYVLDNVGSFASLKGYDAIVSHGFNGKNDYVILNRKKLIIKK